MARWGALLEGAEGGDAAGVAALAAEIPDFIEKFEAHLQGEEEHLQVGWGHAGGDPLECVVGWRLVGAARARLHPGSNVPRLRPPALLQRGGRKHMNVDLSKQMLRRIWDEVETTFSFLTKSAVAVT